MIIKVDVKVAGDDEFMRCGGGKRKERTEFIKKNRKRFGEGGRQRRRNLFGRHGQSRTTFSGGTALNVNCRTTFQAHESDSQSQQTELTYITRIQTLITQIIQKP